MALISKTLKRLRSHFLDEHVIIYLRDMNVVAVDENQQEIKISAMIETYIVDIDENYLYTGLPDGTITRVIQHEIAPMIEIAVSVEDQLLEMNLPSEDEDVH